MFKVGQCTFIVVFLLGVTSYAQETTNQEGQGTQNQQQPDKNQPTEQPAETTTGTIDPIPTTAKEIAVAKSETEPDEEMEETPVLWEDGFVISAGFGSQFAGLGAQASYYIKPRAYSLRLAPYLCGGYFPASEDLAIWGYCLGASALWGVRHNILLDINYGLIGIEGEKLAGQFIDDTKNALYGLSVAGGYEFNANNHFLFRILMGISYIMEHTVEENIQPSISVGVGYKL